MTQMDADQEGQGIARARRIKTARSSPVQSEMICVHLRHLRPFLICVNLRPFFQWIRYSNGNRKIQIMSTMCQ